MLEAKTDNVTATVTDVTNQVAVFAPSVVATVAAAVQIAETTGADGKTKFAAVMDAIQGASGVATTIPVPQVAAIATLVNLVVSIFNATGFFRHK